MFLDFPKSRKERDIAFPQWEKLSWKIELGKSYCRIKFSIPAAIAVACEPQTYFRSSLLSLRPPPSLRKKENRVPLGTRMGNKSVFTYTNIKKTLKITSCNMSLCVTQHNYPSLPIMTHKCTSLSITTHDYTSLSITPHHYTSLSITTHHYPSLHITGHHYTALSITTQHYPSLHISVHY